MIKIYKKISKKSADRLGIIFVAFIIGISLQVVYGWTEPDSFPPSGNVNSFLNISSTPQYKSGALGIGGLFETSRDTYLAAYNGYMGVGTTTPQEKLVLDGGNFLHTPSDPSQAGIITDNSSTVLRNAVKIYVSGDYAYVASLDDNGFEIVDISDPSNPIHAGGLSYDPSETWAYGIYISGKYAYVTYYLINKRLEIVDISDPSNPTYMGHINDGDGGALLDTPFDIYVSGKYAYAVDYTNNALEIINISDPANPTHAGSITDANCDAANPPDGCALADPRGVVIQGNYAYIASKDTVNPGVEILDISDPANPAHEGVIYNDDPSCIAAPGGCALSENWDIYVSGDYAYVVSGTNSGMEIIDISDPANPAHAGAIFESSCASECALLTPYNIYVSGKYAYTSGQEGIEVIDISNPANPQHAGAIMSGNHFDIFISGKYAYTTSLDSVRVYDISGISSPAASIFSLSASTANVSNNADIANNLTVGTGVNVGPGGIQSGGPIRGSNIETLGVVKLTATTTAETCNASTNVGSILYNDSSDEPCYCNGTDWLQFDEANTCPII